MIYIHLILLQIFFILTFVQLSQSSISLLPIYNPTTRCHDLILTDKNLTFAICLQRASNKQHPFNLYTSSVFCSTNYPPNGHLIDLFSLSSSIIDLFLQSLTNLLNSKTSHIDYPEPNFLWISSNSPQNLSNNNFSCPNQCQSKNPLGKFLIIKTRCQFNNGSKPCITTKATHWDRAPFICLTNQTIIGQKQQIVPLPIHISPSYSNDTVISHDSNSCLIVRTRTHEYRFCFRRQSCPRSQTSAFCTTKSDAYQICQEEKNNSNLLTIENNDEYQLINDIVSRYSNETLMNLNGLIKNKHIIRAQWMWIDGIKGSNENYFWNISENNFIPITDKYWCDNITNCTGGKGRDHVVLNIVCQTNEKTFQVCLASRRQSEPGPFICKRTLSENEKPISNYTFLRDITTTTSKITTTTTSSTTTPAPVPVPPVYEKKLTSIYYDEHHCLTVQTRSHIYSFCLRRQNCTGMHAYCTKWSRAQKNCIQLKNQAQLLTIDNEHERTLITDILDKHLYETRLTLNGSSYPYYKLADFVWIDGIRQADNRTYLWKNGLESIPEHLWCPRNQCNSFDRERVMLNVLCNNKASPLICLGTRKEWKPAPYICRRVRPKDQCPILFDKIRSIHGNEMLLITINRTIVLIKCKHPEYHTEIKIQYECDIETNQWRIIYENENFTCPTYDIPPMATSAKHVDDSTKITTLTSTRASYYVSSTSSIIKADDCSLPEFSSLITRLPVQSRYVYSQKRTPHSSFYYDITSTCYFNQSIQITYRCDLLTKQWIYVHGSSDRFRQCYPPCGNEERNQLFNKYFTQYQQTKIRVKYIEKKKVLRLRCYNTNEHRWKVIPYQCGTLTITKAQWFSLHSCFQSTVTTTQTTMTRTLPAFTVSLSINQLATSCSPPVVRGSPCELQIGEYILDLKGCKRKICPATSRLCHTIRCPPDRICRVIPCKSCIQTDYLQAVCEYPREPTLCELEKRLFLHLDLESINHWERQTIAIVQQYAEEQRQQLTSPWPILTID